MKKNSRDIILGYTAGIVAGASYGLNPLFAKPLLNDGVTVTTMLFFRYLIAMIFMGIWMLIKRESFKIDIKQFEWLAALGLLFCGSSLFLFLAYKYIPSGLATTLIYLYPVFTAIIMVFLKVYPSWQVWLSIFVTLGGVVLLCLPEGDFRLDGMGIFLSILSGLSYTLYLIVINRAPALKKLSAHSITFYALASGSLVFLLLHQRDGVSFLHGIDTTVDWLNLFGLAFFPTMISLVTLAISTKLIGPTRTSVLGVFEPVAAIAVGTIFFAEPLTRNAMAGVSICIIAVLFMIIAAPKQIPN